MGRIDERATCGRLAASGVDRTASNRDLPPPTCIPPSSLRSHTHLSSATRRTPRHARQPPALLKLSVPQDPATWARSFVLSFVCRPLSRYSHAREQPNSQRPRSFLPPQNAHSPVLTLSAAAVGSNCEVMNPRSLPAPTIVSAGRGKVIAGFCFSTCSCSSRLGSRRAQGRSSIVSPCQPWTF